MALRIALKDNASMGPSPRGDGELLGVARAVCLVLAGFNGAVAKRRRRAVTAKTKASMADNRFNGAVAKRRRRGCSYDLQGVTACA